MSQVFERNRKEADSDYLSLAVDIRIEVLSLVMREGVVPKRKRLILGAPIAETARSLVYNVNRANRFYPSNSYNVLERKRYLGLALADCDQLEQDFQCLIAMKCTTASELERISGMIRDEADKVAKKRKYTRIIGKESAEDRLAATRAEAERLEAVVLDVIRVSWWLRSVVGGSASNVCYCNNNGNANNNSPRNTWVRPRPGFPFTARPSKREPKAERKEEGRRDHRPQRRKYAPRAGSRTLLAWPCAPALSPVSWPPRKAAVRAPMLAVRGALHELRR